MAKQRTSLLELDRSTSGARRHGPVGHPGRKPGLRLLESETSPRADRRPVRAQSFDDGGAISLQTASGAFPMYPQQMAVATAPYDHATALDFSDDANFVEPFEDPGPAAPKHAQPPANPTKQMVPAPRQPAAAPVATQPAPQSPQPTDQVTPAPVTAPVTGPATGQVTGQVTPPAGEEDDFDEDIREILKKAAQQPSKPEPPQPIISKPDQPGETTQQVPAGQTQQESSANPHGFFESAERKMAHATTFHVGQLDLNRRFNEIEHALDVEEQAGEHHQALANSFSDAAALDDEDLINDLSAVSSLLEDKLREEQARPPSADAPQPDPAGWMAPPQTPPAAAPETPPPAAAPHRQPAAPQPGTPIAAPEAATPPALPSPEPAAPARPAIAISYKVPVAQATDGVSAQAAAAAMLVAWRDQSAIDMQALVAGTGSWAGYAPGLKASGPGFFKAWGLTEMQPVKLSIQHLADMLQAHGPLWLQNPAVETAVRLIVAMAGDGSEGGTSITVVDPTAGVQDVQQPANIRSLISQLGNGPVRIAHLTA